VEIIAEVLVALVQFLCEVALQLLGNVLAELGWHSVREAIRPSRPPHRIFGLLGFAIIGALLGAASLLALPKHTAVSPALRLLTLLVGPVVSALAVLPIAVVLRRYFTAIEPWWRFGDAYAFALSFALIRFAYAH
jgi:hypothetical protein